MKKKDIQFPDCWEEVKPAEWLYILKLRYKLMTSGRGVSVRDIKRAWCRYVLSNRGYKFDSKVDDMLLIDRLSETLDWMWMISDDGESVELIYDSTVNLLPSWNRYLGPLSHGGDLSFAEFRYAVTLMNKFNESKDPFILRALCGTLYRLPGKSPKSRDFDGKYREDFHSSRMELYAARMKMMPVWMMWGIYAWFAYFCQYVLDGDFIIGGKEVSFSPLFNRKKDDSENLQQQDLGMNSILFSVAESGIFGTAENTDNQPLINILLKLLDDKQRADNLLKKSKS